MNHELEQIIKINLRQARYDALCLSKQKVLLLLVPEYPFSGRIVAEPSVSLRRGESINGISGTRGWYRSLWGELGEITQTEYTPDRLRQIKTN